ncbi:MAG: MarR family EPS-associated transcriptional regulator [Mucilaginibacter sp.]|nr:MarR family EPS-associated transcriptional regulator [Mucilaginibacter sp.]
MLNDADRYRILKRLEANPEISQRGLAEELGLSLGKINFCLNALIERGMLKVENFRNNKHKRAYMYYLTPTGMEEKARVTLRFLSARVAEYEALDREIAELRKEANAVAGAVEAEAER